LQQVHSEYDEKFYVQLTKGYKDKLSIHCGDFVKIEKFAIYKRFRRVKAKIIELMTVKDITDYINWRIWPLIFEKERLILGVFELRCVIGMDKKCVRHECCDEDVLLMKWRWPQPEDMCDNPGCNLCYYIFNAKRLMEEWKSIC